jgi:hypothetical protein
MNSHYYLEPKLRITGTVSPLPHTLSWHTLQARSAAVRGVSVQHLQCAVYSKTRQDKTYVFHCFTVHFSSLWVTVQPMHLFVTIH